jgi:hypothetical protein
VVSHVRNLEYVFVAGPRDIVRTMTAPYAGVALPPGSVLTDPVSVFGDG